MLRVIERVKSAAYTKVYAIFACAITLTIAGVISILNTTPASADTTNINYNVSVAPALTLTTTTNSMVLNLDPSTKTFDSKNITVGVGTNHSAGYTLTLSTPGNSTDLIRDNSEDGVSGTMPTLAAGTYTESTFTENKWGYKITSNTSLPSTVTTDYVPFASGNTLMQSSTARNDDEASLTFAAKIDYLQASGSYATTLNFHLVANPLCDTTISGDMQTFNPCPDIAVGTSGTLTDTRDGKSYNAAKLADGNIWMTENLNLAGGTALSAADTDVTSEYISGFTTQGNLTKNANNTISLPASSTSGFNNNSNAYVYNSTKTGTNCSSPGCYGYYSWIAATLGGKQADGSTAETRDGYNAAASICPKGWKLPSSTTSNAPATTSPNWKTGDYYKLATAYGANLESNYYENAATFYNNAGPGKVPNFLLAGYYDSGSFYYGGSRGGYWSSSSTSSSYAYRLYFNSSIVNSADYNDRYYGFAVRCLFAGV